jgi:hypothetical protein
MEKTRAR